MSETPDWPWLWSEAHPEPAMDERGPTRIYTTFGVAYGFKGHAGPAAFSRPISAIRS